MLNEWPLVLSTVLDDGIQDTFIYRKFKIRHYYAGWHVVDSTRFSKSYPRLSRLIQEIDEDLATREFKSTVYRRAKEAAELKKRRRKKAA
jgi:hypothetical protein